MAKAKLLIILIWSMIVPTTCGYNFEHRFVNPHGHQNSGEISNWTKTAMVDGSDSGRCIAVETMKELGCGSESRVSDQQDPFTSICERHQLCYTCGSALGIQSWTCDQMANLQMFELCLDSSLSPSSRYACLKRQFVVMKLFGEHVYRSMANHSELAFECRQTCVLNYLYSQLK